jgi:signal transduction histidine kinase/ActR/RegA family two-component response regulator
VSDLRVLVCAPIGRDTALTVNLLRRASIDCEPCDSIARVCEALGEGAGAVMLTEEALSDPDIDRLAAMLAAQPAWSDVSILLFAGGDREDAALRTLYKLEVLRNVTLLDRPIRTSAVISTVQSALRGRQRQYELRDVLTALHKARADAERANRLKDEFLATVSHELRTPLNAILGWVSMLRQARFAPERAASVLEIVERNAKAQAQLITDVLDISRMTSGRVRLEMGAVSLARVVADAVDTIRPASAAKGVEIHAPLDEGPIVYGDAERLQQIFWNVLSNACKFTPAGGRIDVEITSGDEAACVRVTDTGPGIPPEFLPYVFDRFRQADQTFTRSHGGLGLGLAIVKTLVEMHGGEVSARSGAERGAVFEITLPAVKSLHAELAHAADSGMPSPGGRLPDVDLSNRVILVVDDDEATRELMRSVFEQCAARVTTASSAAHAIGELNLEVPSLIVADIGMPGEDGLSMMRRIRARLIEAGGTVPAIALSAYARPEDQAAARAAGFDDFVVKPAMPADVIRVAARVLGARSDGSAVTAS